MKQFHRFLFLLLLILGALSCSRPEKNEIFIPGLGEGLLIMVDQEKGLIKVYMPQGREIVSAKDISLELVVLDDVIRSITIENGFRYDFGFMKTVEVDGNNESNIVSQVAFVNGKKMSLRRAWKVLMKEDKRFDIIEK